MSADFDFVVGRIPEYRGYREEGDRHDSDIRVRAILGGSLTDAHVRLGKALSTEEEGAFERLVFFCMFGDQRFIRAIEHASLEPARCEALVAADRELVELEEAVNAAGTSVELSDLVSRIERRFAGRMAMVA